MKQNACFRRFRLTTNPVFCAPVFLLDFLPVAFSKFREPPPPGAAGDNPAARGRREGGARRRAAGGEGAAGGGTPGGAT
jgi:hypothetical protein